MNRAPEIDPGAAVRFLKIAFEANDWLAVFLKWHQSGRVAQRVAPMSTIATSPFQDWLTRENRAGAGVYVSVNALRSRTAVRRRHAVGAVRHVFLDADADLNAVLARIADRTDLPQPSYVLRTSQDRGHVFWRARDFSRGDVEALEKRLAGELHTDSAATACSQLTRLPGYLNHKRAAAYRVMAEYGAASNVSYTPADFPRALHGDTGDHGTVVASRLKSSSDVLQRAQRYLAAVPPAVSGQHGDVHTFRVCCRLARGFALTEAEALPLLTEWNAGCRPPWSERELIDKLRRARRYGREAMGGLLGDRV